MVAAMLVLAGIPFVVLTAYVALIPASAQFHKLDSEEIALTEIAGAYIRDFHEKSARNPTSAEFESWKMTHVEQYPRFDGLGYTLLDAPFSTETVSRLGKPPQGAFVLSYLDHGAWIDYASWYGEGKLAYIPDSVYFAPLGGKYLTLAAFSTVWISLFAVANAMLRRRNKRALS